MKLTSSSTTRRSSCNTPLFKMKLDLSKEEHVFYLITVQVWMVVYCFVVTLGKRVFRARRILSHSLWVCRGKRLGGSSKTSSFVVSYK